MESQIKVKDNSIVSENSPQYPVLSIHPEINKFFFWRHTYAVNQGTDTQFDLKEKR